MSQNRFMKKGILIKTIVCIVVFLISTVVISGLMNQSTLDITAEMKPAEYPLLYIESNGVKINPMRGHVDEMELAYMRDSITPLSDSRTLDLCVEKFGCQIAGISYQVRSVDGERLVENTDVYNYIDGTDTLTTTIHIKDLIDQETEYALVVLLTTKNGQTLRYYTHIVQAPDYIAAEKVGFALDFSNKTFDKAAAREITKYLESNSEGDNTTFGKVSINSSFSQITWGDLPVKRESEPETYIRELAAQTATIELRYQVSVADGKETDFFNVTEVYRMRKGSERMYLLSFDRKMNQIFNWQNTVFVNNKIVLGITDGKIQMEESDGGSIVAFVQENRLFMYSAANNRVAYVFGYYDDKNLDARTTYDDFDIKVLKVDETGNIRFMVYGYMNRGSHEGQVGVQVYYYNSNVNTIEEEVFIPCYKPFPILKYEIGELAYVNNANQLYLLLNASLYCVNLEQKNYTQIIDRLPVGGYKVSASNRMIAWQDGGQLDQCRKLQVMNFNTQKQTQIEAGSGCYVKPIGFMGEDIIYGVAREEDLTTDLSGTILFPMYAVKIEDQDGKLLKDYEKQELYVTNAQIVDNQINLNRVRKSVSGNGLPSLVPAEDDQILDNDVDQSGSNILESVVTEEFEKIMQIALKKAINVSSLKFQTPKEVMYEGGRQVDIDLRKAPYKRFFVYGTEGVDNVSQEVSAAVKRAEEIAGVVVDDTGRYIWMKGNRAIKNQIMKIEGDSVSEERDSLAVCLDTILKGEGIVQDTEGALRSGQSVPRILEHYLEDAQVLELSGCSLDSVLYYVNKDIPVLAMLRDGNAVLIVGYNELNTVIMDPLTGTVSKKGMNDSTEWFAENGNRFVTYIR